tara:strand:- start:607 stop:1767 length:1161 start_codon:yes stop_codon:yes gene_type:complete
MKKRKICVITGSRAEYGTMYYLIKEINDDPDLILQIIVTGTHLSPEFGLTYKEIIKNNFKISKKIEIIQSSDTSIGICKSMGLAMISFSEAFEELKPDICLVLGDRYEIFSAVSSAMISRIPIAHIHGGESTEGVIDEAIRHSITKMSHLHFVANNEYLKKVVQLGENPKRVFNFGTPLLDSIFNIKLLSFVKLEKALNFKLGVKNFLVTFHPVTLEENTSSIQFENLLAAISKFDDTKIIFTLPNSDTNGRVIIKMIDDFVTENPLKALSFKSLGQLKYFSALKHFNVIIGNSSSGLSEAPSFKIPTINIGDRQNGRIKAKSVIDCSPEIHNIIKGINKALSRPFQEELKKTINPYGKKGASIKIKNKIKAYDLDGILKKKFYTP